MSILFDGNACVYLQGRNALVPAKTENNQIVYYIGNSSTKLLLRDFRCNPVNAAHWYLQGKNGFEFADVFNQPAQVRVNISEEQKVEIDLYESSDGQNCPTLWLGILEDNLMPNYDTEWEFLRPINHHSTAFAVLVREDKRNSSES
jgi:hypothetical protein